MSKEENIKQECLLQNKCLETIAQYLTDFSKKQQSHIEDNDLKLKEISDRQIEHTRQNDKQLEMITDYVARGMEFHQSIATELAAMRENSVRYMNKLIEVLSSRIPEGSIPVATFKETTIMLAKIFGLIIIAVIGIFKFLPKWLG